MLGTTEMRIMRWTIGNIMLDRVKKLGKLEKDGIPIKKMFKMVYYFSQLSFIKAG